MRVLMYPSEAASVVRAVEQCVDLMHSPPVLVRGPTGMYGPVSNTKDNPPCNTLFVGNLSDGVDEGELQGLFSNQPVRLNSA